MVEDFAGRVDDSQVPGPFDEDNLRAPKALPQAPNRRGGDGALLPEKISSAGAGGTRPTTARRRWPAQCRACPGPAPGRRLVGECEGRRCLALTVTRSIETQYPAHSRKRSREGRPDTAVEEKGAGTRWPDHEGIEPRPAPRNTTCPSWRASLKPGGKGSPAPEAGRPWGLYRPRGYSILTMPLRIA